MPIISPDLSMSLSSCSTSSSNKSPETDKGLSLKYGSVIPTLYLVDDSDVCKDSLVFTPLPKKFQNLGSMEFAKILMQEAEVAVAPGIGFGEYGEGFVRIGLVENEHRIRQAAKNVKKLISG